MSAGFMLWPRLVERFCADLPRVKMACMQAFNFVIIRGNPCGVLAAMLACYLADRMTPWLPEPLHQSALTLAFLGALVGTGRFTRVHAGETVVRVGVEGVDRARA